MLLTVGARRRWRGGSCHGIVRKKEGPWMHFPVHAHALDLVCMAEIALLPGQRKAAKRSSSALTGTANVKPANVSKAKLGISGNVSKKFLFALCQNSERPLWCERSSKCRRDRWCYVNGRFLATDTGFWIHFRPNGSCCW